MLQAWQCALVSVSRSYQYIYSYTYIHFQPEIPNDSLRLLIPCCEVFFNGLLAFSLRTYLVWENKRFEAKDQDQASRNGEMNYQQRVVGIENEGYGFRNFL